MDDALSYQTLPGGKEAIVGVHIADVSYFVRPGTALDEEAGRRSTSTYLVERVIPMLPSLLCEELCSLNPGVDRLAFSVFWHFSLADASVKSVRFGRSVIRCCARLAYENAQCVIDGMEDKAKAGFSMDLSSSHTKDQVCEDVRGLQHLAKIMRQTRFAQGALSTNNVRLSFKLDESGQPIDCQPYQTREANWLVEEFMLLANQSAATQICRTFPDRAILRRHEVPIERRLKEFARIAKSLGYSVDVSSAGALHSSLSAPSDPKVREVLRVLCIKAMHRAKYFSSGSLPFEEFRHYALNVPLYTHFTSPIRRYPDVLVHRMLSASLEHSSSGESSSSTNNFPFYLQDDEVREVAHRANQRKDGAKGAQDQSIHLYLCQYLTRLAKERGKKSVLEAEALITEVKDRSISFLVRAYGIEERMYLDQRKDLTHTYDPKDNAQDVTWTCRDPPMDQQERQGIIRKQRLQVFSSIRISLTPDLTRSPPIIHIDLLPPSSSTEPQDD